uniref:Uncharacterized protein n=1 Tax=Cannabis sativa TaxID=3483 RepID=A0A803PU74_CANSA
MPRMKRIKRMPDEYDPHVAQLIIAKLTVAKSKNLDKACGGKVGPFKRPALLIDMKRRAYAMLIDIKVWILALPMNLGLCLLKMKKTVKVKPSFDLERLVCQRELGNKQVIDAPFVVVIAYYLAFFISSIVLTTFLFLYANNISFLAAMANCSMRKTVVPKGAKPLVGQVVQAIHASYSAPTKKKSRKIGKAFVTEATPHIKDSSKGKSKVIELDEESTASLIKICPEEANTGNLNRNSSKLLDRVCAQGTWLLSGGNALI